MKRHSFSAKCAPLVILLPPRFASLSILVQSLPAHGNNGHGEKVVKVEIGERGTREGKKSKENTRDARTGRKEKEYLCLVTSLSSNSNLLEPPCDPLDPVSQIKFTMDRGKEREKYALQVTAVRRQQQQLKCFNV